MRRLKIDTVGARTVVTIVSAGSWIATTSWLNGFVIPSVVLAVATILLFMPLATCLADKMNGLERYLQTTVEFILYSGFITLVTAQSVTFAATSPFWYGVPTGFTIGIIPQIHSPWNRLYSIVISAAIYLLVLKCLSDISFFIQKDIYLYYFILVVSAFSVETTNVILVLTGNIFGLIKRGIDAFRDAVNNQTDEGSK